MDFHSPRLLPLIPEKLRREKHVYERYDTRFRAAARMLQTLWRERKGIAIGQHQNFAGGRRKLGSRIAIEAARDGANFLSSDIFGQARLDMSYREPGALVDLERLWSNMLSSMPLAFNLIAPLKSDKKLARRVFNQLLPGVAKDVVHIAFEHSPGRGDPVFTADGTAFDAIVTTRTATGGRGFIAVEVKYSESMNEPEPRLRARYDELSRSSGLYDDPEDETLRINPLQAFWRNHMLAQSMVDCGLYDHGVFVLVAPRQNGDVQRAAAKYSKRLAEDHRKVAFVNLALEDFVSALDTSGETALARSIAERYIDFTPVHELVRAECLGSARRKREGRPGSRPRIRPLVPPSPTTAPTATAQ